jgi:tetratricopeptide (TPR) repeat protein
VIQGFVYQAERTILAWLDLDDNTVLFCESGEDIDYVSCVLDEASGKSVQVRLLEQVKHRSTNAVTLRSPEVIESLGNFVALRDQYPGQRLLFRFFTNAGSAKERGVAFPSRLSGLEAWARIRSHALDYEATVAALSGLRNVLTDAVEGSDHPSYVALRGFLATATDEQLLAGLVKPVEWSLGNEEARKLQPLAEARLIERGHATTNAEAQDLFRILFVHVFRTLSAKGQKRLDRKSLCQIIERRVLEAADKELLAAVDAIRNKLTELDYKVSALAHQVGGVQRGQREIRARQDEFSAKAEALSQSVEALICQVAGPLSGVYSNARVGRDAPPLPPPHSAPREPLLSEIRSKLDSANWVSLGASTGMGKTQLARAVHAHWHDKPACWLTLRGEGTPLHLHFDVQMLYWYRDLTGDQQALERYDSGRLSHVEISQLVASALGSGSLLVIDDMPELTSHQLLLDRVVSLAHFTAAAGVKVLATSQHSLPADFVNGVSNPIMEIAVPPMDMEDVDALLAAAGAPASLRDPRLEAILLASTSGHPVLIMATLRWLEKRGWELGDGGFDGLFSGEPVSPVRLEMRRRVRTLVADDLSRDLLDRLSIVRLPFRAETALVIAAADPSIPRPREHFDDLIGPWVHALPGTRFEVSPLLLYTGSENLNANLRRSVHAAVAAQLLRCGRVDAGDAVHVVTHLFGAEDWLTLSQFMISFLMAVKNPEDARYVDWAALVLGPGKEWPDAIPVSTRIIIRALQVKLLLLSGANTAEHDADLEKLIASSGPGDDVAVTFARLNTGVMLEQTSAQRTVKQSLLAFRAMKKSGISLIPQDFAPEMLVWSATTKIKDLVDVRAVVRALANMTDEERRNALAEVEGREMAIYLADDSYAVEASKAKTQQKWQEALGVLDELEVVGRRPGAEFLLAASLRARAIILADHLAQPETAVSLLEHASSDATGASLFLIEYTRASILLVHGCPDEAFKTFARALSVPEHRQFSLPTYDVFKRAMLAAGRSAHWEEACKWCAFAIRIAPKIRAVDDYERIELLGELAWIHWSAGSLKKACSAMYGVARALEGRSDRDNPRYKEAFLKVGHVLGWLVELAKLGTPPQSTADGNPYVSPRSGSLVTSAPLIAELPTDPRLDILWSEIAMLAEAAGLPRIAIPAYEASERAARDGGFLPFASSTCLRCAALESLDGDYVAAVSSWLKGIPSLAALIKSRDESLLQAKGDPNEAWTELSEEERVRIEESIFQLVLMPAFMGLIRRSGDASHARQALDRLREALVAARGSMQRSPRWEGIVEHMHLAFDPASRRSNIRQIASGLGAGSDFERATLYIALACQVDVAPAEAANAHAVVLEFLSGGQAASDIHLQGLA